MKKSQRKYITVTKKTLFSFGNWLMDGSKKKSYLFSHTVIKHIIICILHKQKPKT